MNCTGKRCIMQHGKVDPATCQCVSYCPQATPPKTKADLIRAMTDEELALFLEEVHKKRADFFKRCQRNCLGEDCYECWLDWLRQKCE